MNDSKSSQTTQEVWHFKELQHGEPAREPRESEFFHGTYACEALVREVIQNSLDASHSKKCRVRFTFGKVKKASAEKYLQELISHLQMCDYLPANYSSLEELNFLNIEDFGTSGLDGATGEDGTWPESNFFNFWWREGKSSKAGTKGGRWGLGKTEFHATSLLHSFWGVTVRIDDKRELLMGKALLKTHELNGHHYNYWGYFTKNDFGPISESSAISNFKNTFSIIRKNEPGLSLVIPLPVQGINKEKVVRSAIIHYFYPILKGMLIIEVANASNGDTVILDENTLIKTAQRQDWHGTTWKNKTDDEVTTLLQFAQKTITMIQVNEIQATGENSKLTEGRFGGNVDIIKKSFSSGEILAFKVPVYVEVIGKPTTKSFVTVFLQRDSELEKADEHYIRSGISICEIQQLGSRPVHGLLFAEDRSITDFLGDCEEPAHTKWSEQSELTKKYDNARSTLRFIEKSMSDIVSVLDEPPPGRLDDFLEDIFNVPAEPEEKQRPTTTKKPEVPVEPKPKIFRIERSAGGFTVLVNKDEAKIPIKAKIKVAYDSRRKNPFKQYEIEDFDIANLNIDTQGCTVLSSKGNEIELEITDEKFKLGVTGFDQNRDLVVNVNRTKESSDKDETQV